ncbi:hypothetical protein IW261DRAFT_1417124 [Armillaria novae-zelandiae]|uniref:Uncharacterized protein n=1 Tax=Armillaria novae-zelandiae TaxID=153914 RepID=A0AA39PFK0_9AGAR|nr:hypothetical protein IW261DRAFT_1417124 [Armillaria novae-zelandiae]
MLATPTFNIPPEDDGTGITLRPRGLQTLALLLSGKSEYAIKMMAVDPARGSSNNTQWKEHVEQLTAMRMKSYFLGWVPSYGSLVRLTEETYCSPYNLKDIPEPKVFWSSETFLFLGEATFPCATMRTGRDGGKVEKSLYWSGSYTTERGSAKKDESGVTAARERQRDERQSRARPVCASEYSDNIVSNGAHLPGGQAGLPPAALNKTVSTVAH